MGDSIGAAADDGSHIVSVMPVSLRVIISQDYIIKGTVSIRHNKGLNSRSQIDNADVDFVIVAKGESSDGMSEGGVAEIFFFDSHVVMPV